MNAEAQRDVLYAALRDIRLGALMMREGPIDPQGAFARYAAEVERVALAALNESNRLGKSGG